MYNIIPIWPYKILYAISKRERRGLYALRPPPLRCTRAALFCLRLFIFIILLLCYVAGAQNYRSVHALAVYILYNGKRCGLALLPFIPLVRFLLIPKVSCYHHRRLLKLADFSMETLFFSFQTAPPPPIVIEHNTHTHTRVFRDVLEQLITYYTYINYNTCRKRQNALVR